MWIGRRGCLISPPSPARAPSSAHSDSSLSVRSRHRNKSVDIHGHGHGGVLTTLLEGSTSSLRGENTLHQQSHLKERRASCRLVLWTCPRATQRVMLMVACDPRPTHVWRTSRAFPTSVTKPWLKIWVHTSPYPFWLLCTSSARGHGPP